MTTSLDHRFRFHPIFAAAALPFGVVPSTAGVQVRDDRLEVRYGPWRVSTPLSNVRGATVTGPYSWPKVIGPAHVSLSDGGLTFASNPERGVCVDFEEPVRGLDPAGLVKHPSLTITVEDPAGLAELLDRAAETAAASGVDAADDVVVPIDLTEVVEQVEDDLSGMTAAELRRRAKERGISGTSRMSKSVLLEHLTPARPAADEPGDD